MGRKLLGLKLEIDLLAWITEKRNNGLAILPSLVRLKALELAKEEKYRIPEGQFKAGNHWCQCFMKRNGLSLRQKNNSCTNACQMITRRRSSNSIVLSSIAERNTATHCTSSLTWMKLHLRSICLQIGLSTTPARRRSQEMRRTESQSCWPAAETVRK